MQLQDLTLFEAMYALKSINQAAQQEGYSQSNVSARLKALEAELQTPLFNRSYQGLVPTAAGEAVHVYAQKVLAATTDLHAQLAQRPEKQEVAISELLFTVLVLLQHRYALTDYQFTIVKSTAMVTDQTITSPLVMSYADFHRPNYQRREKGWLPAAFASDRSDWEHRPFLVNSDQNCPFRRKTLTIRQPQDDLIEVDSWAGIIDLVAAGEGVALLPQAVIQQHQLQMVTELGSARIPYGIWRRQ